MNQPHPDDELLNAALDGETDPDTVAHLGACDACLARLDALDLVRQRVGAVPDPAPADLADRAVTAAADAWRDQRAAVAGAVPAATPAPSRPAARRSGDHRLDDDIVPLRRRPPAPAGGRAAARRRVPGWALGAAAAVAAVLLAVPFVVGGDDSGEPTASAPAGEEEAGRAGLDGGAFDGGELGSLSDNSTLREELLQAVPGAASAAEARTEQAAADDSLAAPAPSAGAPSASTFAAGTTAAPAAQPKAAGSAEADVPCRAEIRAQLGDRLGPLLYTATLRWQGTDAVVLAYRLADTSAPGADHLAFVMARDDCRVLTSQGF